MGRGAVTDKTRKRSPNEKRLADQKKYQESYVNPLSDVVHTGKTTAADRARFGLSESTYGTEYGPTAKNIRDKAERLAGYPAYNDPDVRQWTREAGAEERRESRGFKAGGKVRGCGAATKGLTKGKMR
jgi:hypothetical protein